MLLSFVLPEVLLAVSLLFVATTLTNASWNPVQLGVVGQVIGLITFQLSYPVIIVRARLLTMGATTNRPRSTSGPRPGAPYAGCCCR